MALAGSSRTPARRPSGGFAEARGASPGGLPPGTPRAARTPARRPSGGFAEARGASPGGLPPGTPRAARTPARRPSGGFAEARGASPGGLPPGTPRAARTPARRPLDDATGGSGLYDSRYEHDACGVGFVADLSGRRTHQTVAQALTVLRNLDHRGAKGSDPY